MMVGLAFFDLNIVAAGIVSNAPMMLAKLSNTIIWKYQHETSPSNAVRLSLGSRFDRCPVPDLNSAPTFKQTDCVRLQFHKLRPSLAARAPELSVSLRFLAG